MVPFRLPRHARRPCAAAMASSSSSPFSPSANPAPRHFPRASVVVVRVSRGTVSRGPPVALHGGDNDRCGSRGGRHRRGRLLASYTDEIPIDLCPLCTISRCTSATAAAHTRRTRTLARPGGGSPSGHKGDATRRVVPLIHAGGNRQHLRDRSVRGVAVQRRHDSQFADADSVKLLYRHRFVHCTKESQWCVDVRHLTLPRYCP